MSSIINLGSYDVNKPTLIERQTIRESLDIASAASLNASFNADGSTLTISDPAAPAKSITFVKAALNSTVAGSLENARTFQISGDVESTLPYPTFNGTAAVNMAVTLSNSSVTSAKIASNAVVSSKIEDEAVLPAKIKDRAFSWDSTKFSTNVSSNELSSGRSGPVAIKLGQSRTNAGSAAIDLIAIAANSDGDAKIVRESGDNGAFSITNRGTGEFKLTQTGAAPLIASSNNIERVRIGSQGKITISAPSLAGLNTVEVSSAPGQTDIALKINATTHVTSERAAIALGSWIFGQDSASNGIKNFYLYQEEYSLNRIIVNPSGSVGIGVLEPQTKLHVDGTITATTFSGSATSVNDAAITQSKLAPNVVGNGPAFRVHQVGTASSIANNTYTKIAFSTEGFDTNNNFSDSKFTPSAAGYYLIQGTIVYETSSAKALAAIYKNGVIYSSGSQADGNATRASVSDLVYMNGSTDYVELYAYQASGVSRSSATGEANTCFSACLIRSAI